jgi:hypothetical protein
MRLWSIHPGYLDSKGLVALWREGLLAQNVLCGNTKGYKNHPQLNRFKERTNPIGAIASYLRYVVDEADSRGYNFNRSKIANKRITYTVPVTNGQVCFEYKHLLAKLKERDIDSYKKLKSTNRIRVHPLFRKVRGDIEEWEIV